MTKQETKQETHDKADKIAAEHRCEILPAAFAPAALAVQRRYSQGEPADGVLRARCFAALRACGINTYGWVS